MIELKPVTEKDASFLYESLKERTPTITISFKMPTIEEHEKFIKSKPYKAWYIITENSNPIGNVYLSKTDEIGIFILKKHQGNKFGKRALDKIIMLHPRERYISNINPYNSKGEQFLINNDFRLVQYTFVLDKKV